MANNMEELTQHKIPHQPRIRNTLIFGCIVIFVFIGGFLAWALLAPLESAALASGKITVTGHRRVIQHLEGGIVAKLLVRDESKVKKGQILVVLDNGHSKIVAQLRHNEVFELSAIEARLLAERNNAKKITFNSLLLKHQNEEKVAEIIQSQRAIFNSNQKSFENNIKILQQRIQQILQQIKGHKANTIAITKQTKLINQELKSVAYLEAKKLIEKHRLLSLQREAARLKGKKGESLATIAALKQKIGETKIQIAYITTNRHREILTQLRETQQKLTAALEKEKAADVILTRTNIRSPITGTVIGLDVHTIGGVIRPGQTIMEIVPSKERLVIEAKISPLDIDVVHNGLVAKIRLIAFKTRTTPVLLGKVSNVSADVITNPNNGESFYRARITIDQQELKKLKPEQTLYPGMPVSVMIITAKLTPWQYFISPITNSFRRAFREQ